ncbi:sugar transferase [Natronospora cellulosivora (SeqCode)]
MYEKYIKRVLDILLSIFVGIIFLPFFIIIAILVKIEDRGSIFYLGDRIGRNSKKYSMIKFRTMRENAPDIRNEDGSTYNSKTDPRVTKVGKILRETSIDEVPQIINVIKGEMSLLGPRASTWDVLDSYQADEIDKMKVRPGISGYTQAYYRNGLSVKEKRLKDAWYANNISFLLDVKIFFKTILTVIKRESVYTNESSSSNDYQRDRMDM